MEGKEVAEQFARDIGRLISQLPEGLPRKHVILPMLSVIATEIVYGAPSDEDLEERKRYVDYFYNRAIEVAKVRAKERAKEIVK